MTAAVSELLAWVTGGSALATLFKVLLAVCGLVFGLTYRRYLGILGANRRVPAERQAYNGLRNSLAEGNMAARLYAERLTGFLNWIDRFFGDAGMADRTLFPHAFGLRSPVPLWTAPALDRCMLLAVVYPILTIFAVWAVSGHIGPAESALRFRADLSGWQRGAAAGGAGLILFACRGAKPKQQGAPLWVVLCCLLGFVLSFMVDYRVGVIVTVLVCGYSIGPTGASSVLGAVAYSVVFGLTDYRSGDAEFALVLILVTLAVAFAIIRVGQRANGRSWRGAFLSAFLPAMILACLADANLVSSFDAWEEIGPALLFLGLLPLLNAPFDWFSLGLTRALLRRGVELGGWWPYALALLDAALATVVIAALALTMAVAVQTFDALAVHGGGTAVLPLDALFSGIAAHPSAPEYWWLYALLLSTMIPSLVNLVIGGTSLMRGLPGLPKLLLGAIPARGGVLKWDRHWIATVLTAQVAAGAALGVAAQAFLVVVIIGYIMPFFGLELLDMARDVAAFNLAARVGQLFGVNL
jgi:hypothetical protein